MNATIEQDFDNLYETSMLFKGSDWESQDGRFTRNAVDYSHAVIYWFERFADLLLAKQILEAMNEEYTVLFDSVLDQWVLTSTYATEVWR